MWARIENNTIIEYYDRKQSLVLNDVRYSSQVFTIWTDAQRKELGIVPIVISGSHLDTKYYIEHNHSDAIAGDGNSVIRTIGVKAADRALEDVDAVDEDGNNLLDDDGNQVINYGLKTEKKRIVKQQASGLLAPTDWYVVKSTEVADYDVPANVLSFRADVRSKSNEMETQIDNCTTVDELKALYEYTNTGTEANPVITRPLAEFPEEI